MKKKLLVMITIISVMSWILIPGVNADSANKGNANKGQTQTVEKGNAKDKLNENGKGQEWKEAKAILETEKDALEAQKDALEEQYEAAKKSGNTESGEQPSAQIEEIKKEIDSKKQLMKEKQAEIKATIRSTYTSDELNNIEALAKKIKKENKGITVMPIDSIIAKGRAVKFDTPPVIKDGRILIPVRALTEGFGATVAWDPVEKKVTISNGTTEIVLNLNSNTAYVNGVEVTIDVAPTTLNNRTIVPLRFITETLGLKVNWDDETDTVEIGDDTDETTPTTTTPTTGTTETPATTTPTTGTTTETPATTTPTTGTTETPATTTPTTETPTTETPATTTPTTGTTTETPATTTPTTGTTETPATTTPTTDTTTTTTPTTDTTTTTTTPTTETPVTDTTTTTNGQ